MNRINLTQLDNDILIKHLYSKNGNENEDIIVIDVYVEYIEELDDDLIINGFYIEPILDKYCDIEKVRSETRNNILGEPVRLNLSNFEKNTQDLIKASIREIKINKLLNSDEN